LQANGYIAKSRGGENLPRNFYVTALGLDYLSRLQEKNAKLSVQMPFTVIGD
jgi:hypothetical protein